jgi:putative transposase
MKISIDSRAIQKAKVVGHVQAQLSRGIGKNIAIAASAQLFSEFWEPSVSEESRKHAIYRWFREYEEEGIEGLARKKPKPRATAVLTPEFIAHLVAMKDDEDISIPEVIRCAERLGIVPEDSVSRSTVWRAARNINLPMHRCHAIKKNDMRPFEFKHRMDMILCDGKHFRAGNREVRRVAMPMIDDATRTVLIVRVRKTESTQLFLLCLYELVRRYGIPVCIYVDNGSGFISEDAILICARLKIHLIHGTAGYPEGRGKIERFHRTMWQQLLRTFRGDPRISGSCDDLELRCNHYVEHCYNREKHEAIGMAPLEKWQADSRVLKFPESMDALESIFIIERRRKVSRDNIVQVAGKSLEMPLGYAGRLVSVFENTISGEVTYLHNGETMRLHVVDLEANAHAKRGPMKGDQDERRNAKTNSAARIAFEQMYPPVVDSDGNCFE